MECNADAFIIASTVRRWDFKIEGELKLGGIEVKITFPLSGSKHIMSMANGKGFTYKTHGDNIIGTLFLKDLGLIDAETAVRGMFNTHMAKATTHWWFVVEFGDQEYNIMVEEASSPEPLMIVIKDAGVFIGDEAEIAIYTRKLRRSDNVWDATSYADGPLARNIRVTLRSSISYQPDRLEVYATLLCL